MAELPPASPMVVESLTEDPRWEMGLLGEPVDPEFTIDRYYIMGKQLGTGQFSKVYEAVSVTTNETFAVKVIQKPHLHTAKHVQSLKTEIAILKSCRHTNIVCLQEVYETRTELFLILEMARGGELFEQIVDHGPYSERDASGIIRQIVKAVAYLHSQGIAHRDIKPENILLAEKGDITRIKLADFGLAKILMNVTTTRTPCGTPGYVAPEVLMMMGYDKAVDLWSIGVITFILLCGYPPFHDKQPALLYEKIKKAQYKFHEKYWANISEEAKDFIRKLLVVDPSQRLTAGSALAHPWLSSLATPAQPLNLFAHLKRFNAERKGQEFPDSPTTGLDSPMQEIVPDIPLDDQMVDGVLNDESHLPPTTQMSFVGTTAEIQPVNPLDL